MIKSDVGWYSAYNETGCWLYPRCCSSRTGEPDCPVSESRCPSINLEIDAELKLRRAMKLYLKHVPYDKIIKCTLVPREIFDHYIKDYKQHDKYSLAVV